MTASLAYALEARPSGCPLNWFNRQLLDLCDVPLSVQPLGGINVWLFSENLVFQSAETASTYSQSLVLLRDISRAFHRGEAAEAEGTVLHISRLGRATVCDFVLALVPQANGEAEGMLVLWPRPTPPTGFVVQGRYTLYPQAPAPQRDFDSSASSASPAPLPLTAQQFKFECPKAGRKSHPYAPEKS